MATYVIKCLFWCGLLGCSQFIALALTIGYYSTVQYVLRTCLSYEVRRISAKAMGTVNYDVVVLYEIIWTAVDRSSPLALSIPEFRNPAKCSRFRPLSPFLIETNTIGDPNQFVRSGLDHHFLMGLTVRTRFLPGYSSRLPGTRSLGENTALNGVA